MKAKPRPCKQCGHKFTPYLSLQRVCSPKCALALARVIGEKERKRGQVMSKREAREKLMTRSDWLKKAQVAFNKWIRLRDEYRPCISCGTTDAKWDAGHYRSVGACPELRFHPLNVHKQCAQCNSYKSGNAVEYRINLIRKIGADKVEWLEGPHEPKKYTIPEIREIERDYKALAKAMQQPKRLEAA